MRHERDRRRKGTKILAALLDYLNRTDLRDLVGLDMGASVGFISETVAGAGASVIGIDLDEAALRMGNQRSTRNPVYVVADVGAAPFQSEAFDFIVCSQVYEHTPSLKLLANELIRLLKVGGICFFSGPNRWAVVEDHYGIPFLSWVPRSWADRVLKWSGKEEAYLEQPRSYGQLAVALKAFEIHDLTPEILVNPTHYDMDLEVGPIKYVARVMPQFLWRLVNPLVPNFNWLLIKQD